MEPAVPEGGTLPREAILREKAATIAGKMKQIGEFLQEEMAIAQARMEDQANRGRTPAPRYIIGDQVWLSTANIKTQRPSKKLDHKLRLPPTMKIHPVFHSLLLRLHAGDLLPEQIVPPPPPVVVEGEQKWEVERILDSR